MCQVTVGNVGEDGEHVEATLPLTQKSQISEHHQLAGEPKIKGRKRLTGIYYGSL